MKRTLCILTVAASSLTAACDELKEFFVCKNGYKIEYKYSSARDFWFDNSKDEFVDGALRVSAVTFKDGRRLSIRCFKNSTEDARSRFDLRYTIDMPLLGRLVPDLKKAGVVTLVLSVDDVPIKTITAEPIAHDFGMSYLAELDGELIDKLATAKESIIVMPRQGSEKLDDVIKFGVAELADHAVPVKKACEATDPSIPRDANPGEAPPAKT